MTAPVITRDEAYLLDVVDSGEITYDEATRTYLWLDIPVDADDVFTLDRLVRDALITTTPGDRAPLALTRRGENAR